MTKYQKKMIFAFFVVALSELSHYSLIPPYNLTYGCEIGNWTVSGNTIVYKDYFQLLEHVDYDVGGLCNRVPTYAEYWDMSAEFSPGGTGPEGIAFFHTRELCTQNIDEYTGLAVYVNTSKMNNGTLPVYYRYIHNQEERSNKYKMMCRINNKGHPFTIRVSKHETGFRMDYITPVDDDFKPCFNVTEKDMVSEGYFSFLGYNTKVHVGDFDLLSVNVTLKSQYEEPPNDNSSDLNRKLLDESYYTRKIKKQKRRNKMKVVYKLVNQSLDRNMTLDGNLVNIREGLMAINETCQRLRTKVSLDQIKMIIGPILQQRFERMLSVTQRALTIKEKMMNEIVQMWESTVVNLTMFGEEIRDSMDESREYVLNYTKEFMKQKPDLNYLIMNQNSHQNDTIDTTTFERVLFLITAIEFTLYVLFVIYKRFIANMLKKIE